MTIKIIGLNWRGGKYQHPFDVVDVPARPGVYKLHLRQPDGSWVIFHVGMAANLHEALVWPMTAAEADDRIRARIQTGECAFSYAEVPDEEELKAAVRSIYNYYEPECTDPKDVPQVEGAFEANPN